MLSVKRPAHSGLTIDKGRWTKPTQYEINILQKYFNSTIVESFKKKVDTHPLKLIGYYRSVGIDSVFIKILPDSHYQLQVDSEKIVAWLDGSGLSVNIIRAGFPRKIEKCNLWIFSYDYIDFRFSNKSKKDFELIGRLMGRMHKLMKYYPDQESICSKGVKKNRLLFKQLQKIRENKVILNFPDRAIKLIKKTSNNEFNLLDLHAQMIHGDMNYGNIIFNRVDGKPIIIDFEDSGATWLSPLYDLAFVIQRFILLPEVKDGYEMTSILINSYSTQNTLFKSVDQNTLFTITRMISIRALLILSLLPIEEQSLYLDEIKKFIFLYNKAQDNLEYLVEINFLINEKCKKR